MDNFQLTYNEAAYGSNIALPSYERLQAGAISLEYGAGSIRYIKIGNTEILRMIYFAVRDHNWDTVPLQITEESIDLNDGGFEVAFKGKCEEEGISFAWDCKITGNAQNQLVFDIKGKALTAFRKNRVGFCILHPVVECRGKACSLIHPSGEKTEAKFPENISPHQPMMDIREMTWQPDPKVTASLLMEGDVFEMEDQRNWTDDSYKTYCTPLGLPFPVGLQKGEEVHQKITLEVQSELAQENVSSGEVSFAFEKLVPFPKIGVGASSEYPTLAHETIELLNEVNFDHYRVDIDFSKDWQSDLQNAIGTAKSLGASLLLAVFFSEKASEEATQLMDALGREKEMVKDIYIFSQHSKSTPFSLIELVVPPLIKAFEKAKIGAGTNAYFTELNRERVATEKLDMLTYSINPQVHAFDNDSLTETLQAQQYTVESTKTFSNGLPIHVSPITLQPRFNPNATGPEPAPKAGELPSQTDVRQMSLFGANWFMGSLNYLAAAQCKQITYFETAGTRGFLQGSQLPKLPDKFRAFAGAVFPIFHFLKFLKELNPSELAVFTSTDRLKSELVLAKNKEGKLRGVLTNFTQNPLKVGLAENDFLNGKLAHLAVSTGDVAKMMQDKDFISQSDFASLSPTNGNYSIEIPAFGAVFIQDPQAL